MNIRVEKACGIDVHKSFLVATILTCDAAKETKESTGIYWIPVYTCLEGKVETIVANARQIKNMPGRKTDYLDSEWLAEIGDISVFSNPKSLVGWSGLAPSLNESAGKSSNGHITKKGSKYLRRMLVQCAHVIAGHRPNRLRFFFQRILMN